MVADVFAAVAESTRRDILERLRADGPLSLNELAEPFAMSRQAVTKHLEALRRAGLIAVRRSGRRRLHQLQAEPLRRVATWLAPYEAKWDRRLERLKRHVEDRNDQDRDCQHRQNH